MSSILSLSVSVFPFLLAQTQARDYSTQASSCRGAVSDFLFCGGCS